MSIYLKAEYFLLLSRNKPKFTLQQNMYIHKRDNIFFYEFAWEQFQTAGIKNVYADLQL